VGRWITHLLPHLAADFEIVLVTDKRRPPPYVGPYEQVRLPLPGPWPEPIWLQSSAAAWLRGFKGVFHGTYNAVPFLYRGPSVVSLYDLSWEHHAEDFSRAKRWSFRTQARWSARHAGAVITISEHARHSLLATYGLPAEKVFLAPPSVDPLFSPARGDDLEPLLSRLRIPGRYIVALGGAKRRGLEVAVAAWQRLAEDGDRPQLVVVGPEAPPHHPGLIYAGPLPDGDWSALLAGATAFCYPTRFEGYGIPALEAAASGVPVVCARVGPLPEVLGPAAEWCDTPTVADVAAGLARVVDDRERQEVLRQAGLARAATAPTWAQSAAVVGAAYRLAAQ
jgi:alpha-1,3-rhamnosyl/mannosyltransferase